AGAARSGKPGGELSVIVNSARLWMKGRPRSPAKNVAIDQMHNSERSATRGQVKAKGAAHVGRPLRSLWETRLHGMRSRLWLKTPPRTFAVSPDFLASSY